MRTPNPPRAREAVVRDGRDGRDERGQPGAREHRRGGLSFLVATLLVLGLGALVRQVGAPMSKLLVYAGGMGVLLLVPALRQAVPAAQTLLFALAACAIGLTQEAALRDGRLRPPDAVEAVIHAATGLGHPTASLRVSRLLGGSLEGGDATTEDADAIRPYLRYIEKIDARASEINILASHLASLCEGDDHLCETAAVARFVTDDVAYREDPRGGPDYVKTPQETLAANAGDCEDKTILLVSLLESLGDHTWLAFGDNHVYPLVCFDRTLADLFERRAARRGAAWRARYLESLAPGRESDEILRRLATATETRLDGRACYELEPTATGSFLGVRHAPPPRLTLVDPFERKVRVVTAAAPDGSTANDPPTETDRGPP